MAMMMLEAQPTSVSANSERDLRRQIDRSISRALVDDEYASLLLSDPTVVLEDRGCAPQHHKLLRTIYASDLLDFARQAQARFWAVEPWLMPVPQEDQPQLAVAAR